MLCRQCGTELVPAIVTNIGGKKEHWKLNGELVYACPKDCRLNQHETASWQKRMRKKPKPKFVRR